MEFKTIMKERILLVSCHGLGNGGIQAVMMNIVRNLSHLYTFDVILFTEEKRYYDDEFLSYGGKIFRIPHYNGKNKIRKKVDYLVRGPILYTNAKKIILENGPYKAIHCHNAFESAPFIKAAKELNIPVRIVHSHTILNMGTNFLVDSLKKKYLKTIKRSATKLIGCSAMSCNSMFGNGSNYVIVPNPYDNAKFSPDIESISDKRDFVITQVGRFDPNKNQMFALSVLNEIKKKHPEVKLNLVGFDDPFGVGYLDKMKCFIQEHDLQGNVTIYEFNANLTKILEKSSTFILPSKNEGFGIVLIEAQAMGLTCFASDSIPNATNVGGCTFLSLGDGPKFWAEKIIENYELSEGVHKIYDCSEFSLQYVNEIYTRIYNGEAI